MKCVCTDVCIPSPQTESRRENTNMSAAISFQGDKIGRWLFFSGILCSFFVVVSLVGGGVSSARGSRGVRRGARNNRSRSEWCPPLPLPMECFVSQGESNPERWSHAAAPDMGLGVGRSHLGISEGCLQLGCGPRVLLILP